jgi:hypothetical protein
MATNPYESPKVPQPVQRRPLLRRSVGGALILLLTPVAIAIAYGGSCAATNAFLDTNVFGQNYGLVALVGFSIFLIPPIVVFIGMVWWFRAYMRAKTVDSKKAQE